MASFHRLLFRLFISLAGAKESILFTAFLSPLFSRKSFPFLPIPCSSFSSIAAANSAPFTALLKSLTCLSLLVSSYPPALYWTHVLANGRLSEPICQAIDHFKTNMCIANRKTRNHTTTGKLSTSKEKII